MTKKQHTKPLNNSKTFKDAWAWLRKHKVLSIIIVIILLILVNMAVQAINKRPEPDLNGLTIKEACEKLTTLGWEVDYIRGDNNWDEESDCSDTTRRVVDYTYYNSDVSLYFANDPKPEQESITDAERGGSDTTNETGISKRVRDIVDEAALSDDGYAEAVREVRVNANWNDTEPDGTYSVVAYLFDTTFDRSRIEQTMANVYLELYMSGEPITDVTIAIKESYSNRYGDSQEIIVYQTTLSKEEADKINWNADEANLQINIIPNVWTVQKMHDDIKEQD